MRGHTGPLRGVPPERGRISRLSKQRRDTDKSKVNNGARLGALRRGEEREIKKQLAPHLKTKLRARFSFR